MGTIQEADAYWSWSPEQTEEEKEQDSYWNWTEESSVDVLSTENIVKNLKTTIVSHKDSINKPFVKESKESSSGYWDEKVYNDDNEGFIIQDDELARRVLSSEHIINNLLR